MSDKNEVTSRSKEENSPVKYLEFDYQGRRFQIIRFPLVDHNGNIVQPSQVNKKPARLEISDENGLLHGRIFGAFIKDQSDNEVIFNSDDLQNMRLTNPFRHKPEKLPGHIPGLVRESITQILVQGKIEKWISSGTLLDPAVITYEKLLQDSRLKGVKKLLPKSDPDTNKDRYHYFLSKK